MSNEDGRIQILNDLHDTCVSSGVFGFMKVRRKRKCEKTHCSFLFRFESKMRNEKFSLSLMLSFSYFQSATINFVVCKFYL